MVIIYTLVIIKSYKNVKFICKLLDSETRKVIIEERGQSPEEIIKNIDRKIITFKKHDIGNKLIYFKDLLLDISKNEWYN